MNKELENIVIEYVKDNFRISEDIYPSCWNRDRMVKHVYIDCPCGNDRLQFVEARIDKDNNAEGGYHFSEMAWKLLLHIERKIRLNADKKHIDILINLIGKEDALDIVHKFARKNVAVAAALLKHIEVLTSDALEAEEEQ